MVGRFFSIVRNFEIVDISKLVTRWFSNPDCIAAQINDNIEHAIHEWSELPQGLIRLIKVRTVRTIASFDSKTNDPNVEFMKKVCYLWLACHLYSKILLLLLLALTLFIIKTLITADQAVKLVHQIIIFTNAFLNLLIECKEKIHPCHAIEKAASKAIKERLTRRSRPTVKMSI